MAIALITHWTHVLFGQVDKVEKINGNKPKNFTFNVVFEPNASQQDVFEHSGVKQMIEMALEGYVDGMTIYKN